MGPGRRGPDLLLGPFLMSGSTMETAPAGQLPLPLGSHSLFQEPPPASLLSAEVMAAPPPYRLRTLEFFSRVTCSGGNQHLVPGRC